MKKVLIIKTGYSEILEGRNNSRKLSLGDVLRTTPILHLYKEENITWVTDIDAFPLLKGNPLIYKLLPYDFTTALQLEAEEFDTLINLEKIPGICALSDKIRARRNRYGFTFNSQTGEAEAYDKAYEVLAVSSDKKTKRENKRTSQELLFEMLGYKWNKEEYSLSYKPRTQILYDVALNTNVGQKWPTKSWPNENWDKLEKFLINDGIRVTRQDKQDSKVLKDLYLYMDWINSSKVIVTNDSLGLHLGIAMKKRVLGLFGPTPSSEVYFYGRGNSILPEGKFDCISCFSSECTNDIYCMSQIHSEKVYAEIKKQLTKND
ncbi:MAG: glycosyltransferase family 9 protein [Nanoarchaeota archaeon]